MSGARIVIVGGGFGGAFAARYLTRYAPRDTRIELINDTNYFVFQPLLPEVASGTISAPDAVTPLRYMLSKVRIRMAQVISVDTAQREVTLLQGSRRIPQQIAYDHLVIAVGQETDLSRSPGMQEHSLCMRNLADAHELRNRVIECLEHADVTEDAMLKQELLTFVVAGGGFSGTETIGELIEMIDRTLKFYPNISTDEVRAVLIQRGAQILPELSEKLGEYAANKLGSRNVEVICGASVVRATATAVFLDDGTRIDTHTLVTTVGNGPRAFTQTLGVELQRGKLPVDENLRVAGSKNMWALGDAALVPLHDDENADVQFAPPTAQFAVREARCVAKNIAAQLSARTLMPFAFKPFGSLASIGHYKAVAEIFGLRISGLLAWLLWRSVYIGMLPGFSTRLRVALNWMFDYFLPRSIVQIANRHDSGTRFRCFAKGDVVSRPGQVVDGFYTVISGCLESRVASEAADDFVRVLGPGDHWGERSLSAVRLTVGTLTAVEDTRVMILPADDFRNLCETLPPMENYFGKISDKIYAPELRSDV